MRLVGEVFRKLSTPERIVQSESSLLGIRELEEVARIVPPELLRISVRFEDQPEAIWGASRISDREIATARAALREIQNPLGRCFAASVAEFWGTGFKAWAQGAQRIIAQREMALAVIGIRLHRLLHESPPASLQALVDTGILTRLPADPSSGQPLVYDSSHLKVSLPGGGGAESAAWPDEQR
jgi:hypothetical protein